MTWSDIQTRFYLLTKTNSTSMSAANLNSFITPAHDHVVALINKADSRWQWDDTNQSDLPIATTGLVINQQDYSLATSHLTIDRIEVKNTSGTFNMLTQIDQQLLKRDQATALTQYLSSTGTPSQYDLMGSSIFLYPIPNYTQTASLKIYFTRAQLNFDYSTGKFTDATGSTASSPGFNTLFHDLIPLVAAYDYSLMNLPQLSSGYLAAIQRKEIDLVDFFGRRNRDDRSRLTASTDSNM